MAVIVFESNAGHTENYGRMLGEILNIPVYSNQHAKGVLGKGEEVFFMGWLCAETVKGYKKAAKTYDLCGVCAVGMTPPEVVDIDQLKRKNEINGKPFFYLQGGLEPDKLSGIYKKMMAVAASSLKKGEAKGTLSPKDAQMIALLKAGGSCVKEENLRPIVEWWGQS
jgi:hypothetical protein